MRRRKFFYFLKRKRNYLADNLTEHSKQSDAKAKGLAVFLTFLLTRRKMVEKKCNNKC